MKTPFFFFLIFFTAFVFTQCNSQSGQDKSLKTLEFKVWGNCEMCKETIEKALDRKGIKSADWNMDSKMIKVVFDPAKITEEAIHQAIAEVGYDTEKTKGSDKAYAGLPECCQYERRKP